MLVLVVQAAVGVVIRSEGFGGVQGRKINFDFGDMGDILAVFCVTT